MKPLGDQIDDAPRVACAAAVIEVLFLGMKTIRSQMRSLPVGVTIPQFRILVFLKHHPQASLSSTAEHIGLTLPSMSNAVDALVRRGLVERESSVEDRRRITLTLTADGSQMVEEAVKASQSKVAEMLSGLEPEDIRTVEQSMHLLREMFGAA